jgi:hypothetical protein
VGNLLEGRGLVVLRQLLDARDYALERFGIGSHES